MNLFKPQCIEFLSKIKEMNFIDLKFKRGLGIIEDMFIINFSNQDNELCIEVQCNFRIRDNEKILLVFNDLYIDKKGNELSVRRYRSQFGIEKTYLNVALTNINSNLHNVSVVDIITKEFGDIYIAFSNSIVLEVINDTHLENSTLFRIIDKAGKSINKYEIEYSDGNIVYKEHQNR